MTSPKHQIKTRLAYDTVAADYHVLLEGELSRSTWERLVLAGFAERVDGRVADVGCGPGRITAYLAKLGVDVQGIDLSPGMIAVAREAHPTIDFSVGDLLELDLPDASLGGLVAWYSLIHVPPELWPAAFAEFFRVLRPGGHLLLGFKVGDEKRVLRNGYGHEIDLDVYWMPPQRVADLMTGAGIDESLRLVRAAVDYEGQPQAYLLGVRPER
ncbi:class I SAM-dependent methyltransferase [Paractinoplanes ferrugineus]|uniref:Methyltransferase n=1 Tax=Paractinoplanes ferrugineus TaxID=113564 RepID=A0A919J3A2_9ACTN|nr:class I SAM-dependent methyltransferase [Actinoplanes ferrugineus]GIE11724.1 methyltransferase [Actinoplanes ferrugineus]